MSTSHFNYCAIYSIFSNTVTHIQEPVYALFCEVVYEPFHMETISSSQSDITSRKTLTWFVTIIFVQSSLQSLEGTVAAASFADELHKWHKQLQTIEAVLVVWLKVQQLWVQLEEVQLQYA